MSDLSRPLAVIATTPDDSHIWNLVSVQLQLEERGFAVHNLGACTPCEAIAEAVRDLQPVLLIISSINGHGKISIPHVLQTLEKYQLKWATRILVGGLLSTDPTTAGSVEEEFRRLGCSAVFTGPDAWDRFDQFLHTPAN